MSTTTTDRRVVSVVFADLVGFTALSERLDAEDVARIQDHYFALAADAVAEQGGQVEKFIGDAVMAIFGADQADDTDPVRAVRAARRLVAGTAALERRLGVDPGTVSVRVGVNTGEVVVTRAVDGGWRVTGDPVNTAARLQTAAAPGQVLLGPETAFGVAHAFVVEAHDDLELKGKAEPLRTWRVIDERPEPRRGLRSHGLQAPLLGRDEELGVLRRTLAEVTGSGRSGGLVIVAPPGVGKSRLVEEFAAAAAPAGHPSWTVRLGDEPEWGYTCVARLLHAACRILLPAGSVLRSGADASPGPGAGGTGVGPAGPGPAAELAAALVAHGSHPTRAEVDARHTVRLLRGERLDAEPVDLYTAWTAVLDAVDAPAPIWVVEDFHLAGPDLRAFVRHALAHPRPGGRLVVVTARPTSGLDEGSTDLAGVPVHHLEPLTEATTRRLITALVGESTMPDAYRDAMVTASGGNPLFVEELLRSWIQSGALHRDGAGWVFTGRSADPVLPSTVQAIYRGQLDALPAPSRAVVERGSVPGVTFPARALPSLGVTEPQDPLDHLTGVGLLVGPHEHTVSTEAYTYRHTLGPGRRSAAAASLRPARSLTKDPSMATDAARTAALIGAEWSAFLDLLDDERTAWDGPTRLAGWTVQDLARHAHWGITLETEGLVLCTSGGAGRAAGRHVAGPREDVVARVRSARQGFVQALAAVPDELSAPVPMPYGDVPLGLALDIFLMEAALHRSDLLHAVTGEVALLAAAAPACAAVLRTYWAAWAMDATTAPEAGTAVRLRGHTVEVEVGFDGEAWGPVVGEPSVVVSGPDDAVLLYAYGRVPLEEAGLTVTGDRWLAERLKELVPGP